MELLLKGRKQIKQKNISQNFNLF